MTPGQPVAAETLIDRVWGDRPPRDVRNSLYTHVSAVRRLLERSADGAERAILRRVSGGYVLEIDPDRVDLHRSRQYAAQARGLLGEDVDHDRHALELLRDACSLWRGNPLAGLTSDWAARARTGLDQEQLALVVQRYQVELRLGEHASAVGPLAALLADHPLVEPLVSLLMLALYHGGRHTEAADLYARTRQTLVAEFGDEPGAELRQLHEKILRRDPTLRSFPGPATPTSVVAASATDGVRPAQLPPDVTGFTGRASEVHRLDSLIPAAGDAQPATVVISAIDGTAGIGKTTLAVHWSHRVAEHFSDGQLYANLHGFDLGGRPVEPDVIIRGFLDALGVPPQRVPASLEAQVGLYRSMLSERRMLILLDNARDVGQVRPLLPGSPGCLVVVTSRNQLSSLVAVEGAHPLTLDLLTHSDARRLLEHRIGADRVAAEPQATEEIITYCARLPLALAVVAARAATQPDFPLTHVAQDLRVVGGRLDAMSYPDGDTDLRAVFSWSYDALCPEAAQLFRLLGLHPGPDVSAPAAAALAGTPTQQTRRLLGELVRAHLVAEQSPGRYVRHDLLGAYAVELTHAHDPDHVRQAATHRLLDFYLHTAHAAAIQLYTHRTPITLDPPLPAAEPEPLDDHDHARAWLAREHRVLLRVTRLAAAGGFDTHAWKLAWTTSDFLRRQGHWHDWERSQTIALDAARRLADTSAQALARRGIAHALTYLGSYADAHTHLLASLDLLARLDDQAGQARTHRAIAQLHDRQGHHAEALSHVQQALALCRAAGDLVGQANAFNEMGWLLAHLGNHQQALDHCQESLVLQLQVGHRTDQAATWDSLGYVHHCLGQYPQAASCYQHALDIHRELDDRYYEANVLTHLGDTHLAMGDQTAASREWKKSLHILQELDHPDAEAARGRLDRLTCEQSGAA